MIDIRVWAPLAQRVDLVCGAWRLPMEQQERNYWWIRVAESVVEQGYKLSLDRGEPIPDPRSAWQPDGVHGSSFVVDHTSYKWQHPHFRATPAPSAVIYEMHVGTFSEDGTFRGAHSKLDHLVQLGVTHVEVMPIAQFPGRHGWGYDGVLLYAPHNAYGTPDDLKAFIDACHFRGLGVILDVVYNHLGPDGNYLAQFGPYFTQQYRTPWGDAVNLDQPGSDEVRRFFIDNALMWLRDYHFDGLRLDAVHAMGDKSAVHFLESLAREVEELSISVRRELVVTAESDLNDPRLVWSREAGGYQLHAAWSDDFHNAIHALLTGEQGGYYADYGSVSDVKKALIDVFTYDGNFSAFRQRAHGRPIFPASPRRFIIALQNHDQTGNRAAGERIQHLVGTPLAKIAAALTLTASSIPLLFQGEEWAASTPFQYFTDHQDDELAQAVSEGRKREFGGTWGAGDVPDPQEPETFARSKLRWPEKQKEDHADMLTWYRDLLAFRQKHGPHLDSPVTRADVDEAKKWLLIVRGDFGLAVNFGQDSVRIPIPGKVDGTLASGSFEVTADEILLEAFSVVLFEKAPPQIYPSEDLFLTANEQ